MDAPPVQYVTTSDGYNIAYTVSGQSPFWVHTPFNSNHLQLLRQKGIIGSWLEQLEQRFQVIYYDSRGQGLSARGLRGNVSISDFEKDLEAVVDRVRPRPFVLFGAAFSAHVAVRYAVNHPATIEALILWNCPTKTASDPLVSRLEIASREDWQFYLDTAAQMAPFFADPASAKQVLEASVTYEDFLRRQEALRESNVETVAPRLQVPTLILATSSRAWATGREEDSKRLASLIPGARLALFDDMAGGIGASESGTPRAMPTIDAFLEEVRAKQSHTQSLEAAPQTASLSPRELDVLRLIAAGKTNQQIADQLVISRNTVLRHVNHIFDKTGVANRVEAASYAHRHGIAG